MIGRPEEFDRDPRFHDHATRARSYDEVYAFLAEIMRTRTTAEWTAGFAAADIPYAPMHTIDTLLDDPHLHAVGLSRPMQHASEGTIVMVGPAVAFSRTPAAIDRLPPRHGEHTAEILDSIGYAGDEKRQLLGAQPAPARELAGT